MQDQRTPQRPKSPPGIRQRHAKDCRSWNAGRCNCQPSYDVWVWSQRDGKKLYRTFKTQAEAKRWRAEASTKVGRGEMRAPGKTTLREAGEALIEGMKTGKVLRSNGRPFKPSTVRGYEDSLRKHVYRDLGGAPIGKLQRRDIQRLVDRLLAQRLKPMTVRNAIMPLRTIFRRAIEDGDVAVNPCQNLRLPAADSRRERIASPKESAALLAALREADRAVWATAFYAGLRRSELQGLQWTDVDLDAGVIHVRQAWDEPEARFIEPKSRAGKRDVPIFAVLREHLIAHRLRTGRSEGFVFGRSAHRPFVVSCLRDRSLTDWRFTHDGDCPARKSKGVCNCETSLEPIGLHEARHTCASVLIDAGVNAKAISTYMGHGSIAVTFDTYGHLMPGNEAETVERVDAYLSRSHPASGLAHRDEAA
jgi:integrase